VSGGIDNTSGLRMARGGWYYSPRVRRHRNRGPLRRKADRGSGRRPGFGRQDI